MFDPRLRRTRAGLSLLVALAALAGAMCSRQDDTPPQPGAAPAAAGTPAPEVPKPVPDAVSLRSRREGLITPIC
jgi:hypothetical protein